MARQNEESLRPAAAAQARLGEQIAGKYELQKLLGVGGMAAVFASEDEAGNAVAIKLLHQELASNQTVCERFRREAELTRSVDHPGRLTLYEDGVLSDGCPYMVMERLDGAPLDRLWKHHGRRLPVAYTLKVAYQVLDLLAVCHRENIIHRDLKPANVFITRTRKVKVLDFGVARRLGGVEATLAGTALGTPAYMAPEQAMGTREAVDGRADLFSVGALLYTLISGKKIHNARSEQEAFVLAATRPAASVAKVAGDLAPEVAALIDRALQWDRRNRFTDAEQMRDEIALVLKRMHSGELTRIELDEADTSAVLAALAGEDEELSVDVPVDDEVIFAELKDIFLRMERTLGTVRQYGLDHPMPSRAIGHLHGQLNELLRRNPDGLVWDVRPHSFMHGSQVVWEPVHPYDQIPYNLFASGFRRFALRPGITSEELATWLDLVRRDPKRDFAPEDDLATAFWERQLAHVDYEVVSSFLNVGDLRRGEDDEEVEQAEDDMLEALLDQVRVEAERSESKGGRRIDKEERLSLEARAVAISARATALEAARSEHALGIDEARLGELRQGIELTASDWRERFADALVAAALESLSNDRLDLLSQPLSEAVVESHNIRELADVLELLVGVVTRVKEGQGVAASQRLGAHLLGDNAFSRIFEHLAKPALREEDQRALAVAAGPLGTLLASCGPAHLEAALEAALMQDHPELRQQLLAYVQRQAPGREGVLGKRLREVSLDAGREILNLLDRLDTVAAHAELRHAEQNPSPELRVEAVALRAAHDPGGLRDELARLATEEDARVRCAALTTMARHQVKEAGPVLVKQIQEPGFHKRPRDERQLAFATLHSLSPTRAESLAIELAAKGGTKLGLARAEDESRLVAIELLSRHSRSSTALEVLDSVRDKWSNAEHVRSAAGAAATAIRARLEDSQADDGGNAGGEQRSDRSRDDSRRQHVHELGAGVVLSLYRLLKTAQLHALDNRAVTQQLEQTTDSLHTLCERIDAPVSVLFTRSTVFVNGQLLKGSRTEYEAALELGEQLGKYQLSEVSIEPGVTSADLEAWVAAYRDAATLTEARHRLRRPSPRIRMRRVRAARLFEEGPVLTEQEQIVRNYAQSIVVMRQVFEGLRAGKYALPNQAKRIAQKLVSLSEGDAPAFLGVTAMRSGNHDAAGRAVNTSVLAVAMARQLTTDLGILARIAMSALLYNVGEPYLLGLDRMRDEDVPMIMRLSAADELRLPAATALVLTAMGRLREASLQRAVISFEAQWLEQDRLGALYAGTRPPSFAAHIVAAAHRFNALLTPDPAAERFLTPDEAVHEMREAAEEPAAAAAVELLVGAIGLFPTGTCVGLSSGEQGVVLSTPGHPAHYVHPLVRILVDEHGREVRPPIDVDLRDDPLRSVAHVIADPPEVLAALSAVLTPGAPAPSVLPPSVSPSEVAVQHTARPPVRRSLQAPHVSSPLRPPRVGPTSTPPTSSRRPSSARPHRSSPAPASGPPSSSVVTSSPPPPSVRSSAPPPIRSSMAPAGVEPVATGVLEKTPLAHLFIYLLDRGLNGTLLLETEVRGHPSVDGVWFEEGAPSLVYTQRRIAPLSHVLAKLGFIPESTLRQPRISQAGLDGPRLEALLLDLNLVDEEQIRLAREEQLLKRLEHVFKLPGRARYSFFSEELISSRCGRVGAQVHPLGVLMAAMRPHHDHPDVERVAERLGNYPLALHPRADIVALDLNAVELGIIAQLQRTPMTLPALLEHVEDPRAAKLLVHVLALSRYLDLGPAHPPPARRKARRSSLLPNSAARR